MTKLYVGAGLLVVLILGAISSLFTVDERQQVLVLRFGEARQVITEPGLYWKVPFADNLVFFEKRIMNIDLPPQEMNTRGQRKIIVDSFTRFRIIDPLKAYQAARNEATLRNRLSFAVSSAAKATLGKSELNEIVTGRRADLMRVIAAETNKQASNLGLEVVDVRLKRVDLLAANSQSVFARMRSDREKVASEVRAKGAEAATKIRATADRRVAEILSTAELQANELRGEADAEATRIFAEVYGQDKDFFEFYRTLQAYRKTLKSSDTSLVLSSDSEFLSLFTKESKDK